MIKIKRYINLFNYYNNNQYLKQLPKIPQKAEHIKTLYSPKEFRHALLKNIHNAKKRIYVVALYLEQDKGGKKILETIFHTKQSYPKIQIKILVDWHRAHRGRIGLNKSITNTDWYYNMAKLFPNIDVPIYGVPVNTREALGVLHLKGFIIDDKVIYTGANINNVYLHQENKYCYDRYHIIANQLLADAMFNYINTQLINTSVVNRLDKLNKLKNMKFKNSIRLFRQTLKKSDYCYQGQINTHELTITPLVGLGKYSHLNQTIHHLICSTKNKLILCTPYFNMPNFLIRNLIYLLRKGTQIEIIVGDKISNDFYISEDKPFKIISTLPYLYEINLRCFLIKLQNYIDTKQLLVKIWKNENNGYHLKGIWVDEEWQLLTGNNLNPRSWKWDLENALLIHDPHNSLYIQREQELSIIRMHTTIITHYSQLQNLSDYPIKVRKLIRKLHSLRVDLLINRII